jgi:hypothetical protein
VIAPGAWPSGDPMQEYRGVQLMLKEAHVQFDIIEDGQIENLHDKLRNYKLIILPDITYLSKNATAVLQQLASSGVHLLATNRSFSDNPSVLKELFGATAEKSEADGSGHYLDVSDHGVFPGLRQQTMVFLKFNLGMYKFDEGSKMMLPVLTKGRPGPPEIIGGHEPSGYYACSMRDYGKGRTVLMPLNIGKLYFLHGYEQHKNIVLDVIRRVYPAAFEDLITEAHDRVEIIAKDFRFNEGADRNKEIDGRILHFVNITGFSGNTYFKPHGQRNIGFTMKMPFRPSKAYTLTNKRPVEFNYVNGSVSATLRDLGEYEAVVFER